MRLTDVYSGKQIAVAFFVLGVLAGMIAGFSLSAAAQPDRVEEIPCSVVYL